MFITFGLLSLAGAAQDTKVPAKPIAKSTLAIGPESEPKLEVSVSPPDRYRTINGGFDLYLTVTNPSPEPIVFDDVAFCFPREVWSVVSPAIRAVHEPDSDKPEAAAKAIGEPVDGVARDNDGGPPEKAGTHATKYSPCWRPGSETPRPEGKDRKLVPFQIPSGKQAYFHLDVPNVAEWVSTEQVLFRRDNYPVRIFLEYRKPGDQLDSPRIARAEKSIELRPSLVAPLAGMVIGTLLVSAFIALRRTGPRYQELKADPTVEHRYVLAFRFWAWTTLRTWVLGLISGAMLVVLLNQTDAQQLPVTVSINDLWGGAFLGLVAFKMADWLDEKFFGTTPSGQQQKPAASSGANP